MVSVVACHARDLGSNPVGPEILFSMELPHYGHVWEGHGQFTLTEPA